MISLLRGVVVSVSILMIPIHTAAQSSAPSILTLSQAVEEALAHSPRIASADAGIKAADGAFEQAGARPNPVFGLEGENVAGGGNYRGIDSADITYGLSQQIELGGKRDARQQAARHQQHMAALDAAITRLDITRDVKQAFSASVAAQEALRYAEEAKRIAEQEMKSVSRRVAEAASPLIQKSKAEVSLATATFNVEQARQNAALAQGKLALLLGRDAIHERLDTASFFDMKEPVMLPDDAIEHTADMRRLREQEDTAGAFYAIEKAAAVPDPTVSLGVRELRETSDRAFVLGLSIPIPVLNSNSGQIAKARAEITRSASDRQVAEFALKQRFAEAKSALRTAYLKAVSYQTTVLPAAEDAFKLARRGYNAGKFQYLEVLDAQRTLFDAKAQYSSAVQEYHFNQAEVERLSAPYAKEATKKGVANAQH